MGMGMGMGMGVPTGRFIWWVSECSKCTSQVTLEVALNWPD